MIREGKKSTHVIFYITEFESIPYCIDIIAKKKFEVKNNQISGVKVYRNYEKCKKFLNSCNFLATSKNKLLKK